MTDERSTGFVLRTRRLTESSLIVHWLAADCGRIATVAKGALRPKSPLRGKLDLFYLADFSFRRSRRSELHTLREVTLRDTHAVLREDLARLRQAAYGSALIEQATEREAAIPGVYQLFADLMAQIEQHPAQPQTVFAFEMRLLDELGLLPRLEETGLSLGARRLLEQCASGDWAGVGRLSLSAPQTAEIGQFLHGFIAYHLGRCPAGRGDALAG